MEDNERKTVNVALGDLRQFMIAECRYGYTRNNHLMPWGAFHHVYEYLPEMEKADPEWAASAASQLAEEAIEELRKYTFSEEKAKANLLILKNGKEDSVTAEWTPGANVYSVTHGFHVNEDVEFALPDQDKDGHPTKKTFLRIVGKGDGKYTITREFVMGYRTVLYEPDPKNEGWYRNLMMPWDTIDVDEGKELLLVVEKDNQLDITAYYKFIRYCLKVAEENGERKPYNHEDFDRFLKDHPDGSSKQIR